MKRKKTRKSINYLCRVFGSYILPIFLFSLELKEIPLKWAGQWLAVISGWFQLAKNFRNISRCAYTFRNRGGYKHKGRFFYHCSEHSRFIAQKRFICRHSPYQLPCPVKWQNRHSKKIIYFRFYILWILTEEHTVYVRFRPTEFEINTTLCATADDLLQQSCHVIPKVTYIY